MGKKAKLKSQLDDIPEPEQETQKKQKKAKKERPVVQFEMPTKPLEESVNKLANYTFGWLQPLITRAVKNNNLTPNDLYPPHPRMLAKTCGEAFAKAWNQKRYDYLLKNKDQLPTVMKTILKAFLGKHIILFVMIPFYYVASLIAPITIQFLVKCITNVQNGTPSSGFFESQVFGYILCAIILVVQMLYSLMDTTVITFAFRMASQGFQGLQDVLYLKMMRIKANNSQMKDVTNLLFTDSFKIQSCFQYFPFIILYSLQALFIIIYLVIMMSYYSLIGIGIVIIMMPIMIQVSNKNVTVQRVLLGYRDSRVGKVQEVLQGVKMIKYFRTELVTEQKLKNIREKELQILSKYGVVLIGTNMLSSAANIIMNAVTFSLLYFFGKTAAAKNQKNYFQPDVIFALIYMYDFLNNILLQLPIMFSQAMEAGISGKRIGCFLLMPEVDIGLITQNPAPRNIYAEPEEKSEKLSDESGEEQEEQDEGEERLLQTEKISDKKNKSEEDEFVEDLIIRVDNLPSFTYAISEDLVIPPVLDTDFALHRDKVQKIMRSYDYYVDLYNNAYEQFFDILNQERNPAKLEALKADCEILKRGPCFDYFKNIDNNPRKIITGDHLTFQQRKKRGELETQKFKRVSHELIATLFDNWCEELDVVPLSKIENLGVYDESKLTKRYEFDSDYDFLRRMFVNLRITTPYYMRFKLHIQQEMEDLAPSIHDLDLQIQRGQIIGVAGQIGCGKSSLFNCLCGEMRLERLQRKIIIPNDNIIRFYDKETTYDFVDESKYDINKLVKIEDKKFKINNTIKKKEDDDSSSDSDGLPHQQDDEEIPPPKIDINCTRIAYFTQVPIIFAGTIRHNIMFYQPYDQVKYQMVCSLCCLLKDFKEWPEGDMFSVGFDGVGLSGGQKARVALARALYYEPELLFLDDPLSAVDAYVSKYLWNELIQGYCRQRGITVMISSHQTQFFGDCDRIIYLEQGLILFDDTVDEMAKQKKINLEEWNQQQPNMVEPPLQNRQLKLRVQKCPPEFNIERHKRAIIKSKPPRINPLIAFMNAPAEKAKASTYKDYFKQGGLGMAVLFAIMLLLQYSGQIFLQVFIGMWAKYNFGPINNTGNLDIYMYVYVAISAATLFFAFFSLYTFVRMAINASRNLHINMIRAIIRTKLSFFDITPNGTIVSRFTKDTEAIDVSMMQQLLQLSVNIMGMVLTIFIIAVNLPSAIVIVPCMIVYFYYFKVFRILTPALKKLDMVFKGPVISQSNETMRSLMIIRCMKFEKTFSEVFRGKVDQNVQAQYPNACCIRWLTFRIQILGAIMSFGVCMSAVLFANVNFQYMKDFSIISVSYCFSIQQFLIALVLAFVQIEAESISVERVLEYTKLPREGFYKSGRELPEGWPKKGGSIEVKNLVFRYRDELPPVIKGINFDVKPYEHVGIVGRTGCAKSTTTMALFRVNNPDEGSKIIFDGINILDDVGLHDSRRGLSIVPQDPFVFSGTLRTTLDKAAELKQEGLDTDEYELISDSKMWEALDRVNLGDYFRRTPGGLDSKITANATNLSSGQKQLLIFAASLISKSFCVIMDEATSQVDKQNDQMVQDLIKEELKDRIVFSIAHRLDTVIEFDKILVMDAGQVMEFDRPTTLLRKKGHFYGLCKNTGRENFIKLKNMALAMERKRFPEFGEIDGIDDNFDDKAEEDPEDQDQLGEDEDSDMGIKKNVARDIAAALFDTADDGEDNLYDGVDLDHDEVQDQPKILSKNPVLLNKKD